MSKITEVIKKFPPTLDDVIVLSIFRERTPWVTTVYEDSSRGLWVNDHQEIPVAVTAQGQYVGFWDVEDGLGYLLSGRGFPDPMEFINTLGELLKK